MADRDEVLKEMGITNHKDCGKVGAVYVDFIAVNGRYTTVETRAATVENAEHVGLGVGELRFMFLEVAAAAFLSGLKQDN